MLQKSTTRQGRGRQAFKVAFARHEDEVREAQRLRWKVFAEEMGARLNTPEEGYDIDMYDPYCEHLLVRNGDTNEVVGTYRVLTHGAAKKVGSYYADNEFDLTRLQNMRSRMVEVGRSCVHPEHRTGGVIINLWAGLADYMMKSGYDYLIGCASIGMHDGGHNAAGIWHAIKDKHLSPIEWRVFPRCPLPLNDLDILAAPSVPPLVKGYLQLGAYVGGEPAWDPDFNTADLFILLPMNRLNPVYARHFLK